ncbi:MAG: CoA transferase, partial [Streptomycetaceae bacterium]|nr:CoA transferase [Streptomycetaceae bacterium]
ALCAAIGRPALADEPRFADNPSRLAHREELDDLLAAVLLGESTRSWERRFAEAGIACAPVNGIDEVFREEHLDAVGMVHEVGHPAGDVRLVASPLRIDGVRPPIRRAPPLHGEHTAAILDALASGEE